MEELIAIVSVGAALAALIIAQSRSLRRDFSARMDRMEAQNKELREHIDSQISELREHINSQITELQAQVGDLRERMAHLEGLLEGLREAITRTRVA